MINKPGKNDADGIEVPDIRHLTLLYTNDIKGNAEQMAYLATIVKKIRQAEPLTLLVDSGNWAKGTTLSDSFKGLPIAEIFSAMKYEAVGIGQGEVEFGAKNLYSLEDKADFPLVCCNLLEEGTGIPPFFLHDYIIINKGLFRIGITGVTAPVNIKGTGFIIPEPETALEPVIKKLNNLGLDLIILLSSLGMERDRKLSRTFPEINVIISGGDNIRTETPVMEGDTFICQAGEKAEFLGSLTVSMETAIKIKPAE